MSSKKMDTEYMAMRRRMSRLRVKGCGKGYSADDNEVAEGGNDPGFKDLIKYWKKHGIPIPEGILSDMADEKVRQAKAKGQGRRRSRELEDLHLCASTGKFNLEKLREDEERSEETSKVRSPAVKKKPVTRIQSESALSSTSPRQKTKISRIDSLKKMEKTSGSEKATNGSLSPETKKKLAKIISK